MRYAISGEDQEQRTVIDWANWRINQYPELKWLYHCPNGGSRNSIEAAKLKQMGVKAGIADLCLPYPHGKYVGLFIEMKYGSNKATDNQKEFLKDMERAGHFVCICYSAKDAEDVLEEYMNLEYGQEMHISNNAILK